MHVVKLISAHCENFKGFKSFDVQFGDKITHIKGANGLGKSSIAELLMWVLHGVGNDLTSNPKVRREVDKIPVADVQVVGEITMEVDGKEIIAKKLLERKNENQKIIDIANFNNEIIDSILLNLNSDSSNKANEEQEALRLSKLVCLENEKLEEYLSQILWL